MMQELLTVSEAAQMIRVSEQTMRKWLRDHPELPRIRLQNNRIRIDRDALIEWATKEGRAAQ